MLVVTSITYYLSYGGIRKLNRKDTNDFLLLHINPQPTDGKL